MTRTHFSSTQQIIRLAVMLVVFPVAFALSVQDEVVAILEGTVRDTAMLTEELKAAKALMSAEFWKDVNDPTTPGKKERDFEKEAKAQAKGIEALDDLEALSTLPIHVRIELYQLRLLQYANIQQDTLKYEEYVNRILEMPDCPAEVRTDNEAHRANLGSPWSILQAAYVEALPDDVIERRKKAYENYALKMIAASDFNKNPQIAGSYNALGQTYWADGKNEKAEALFLSVMEQKDVPGSRVGAGQIGDAMMFLASIELRRGNREKALQYCKDLLAKGYSGLGNQKLCYSIPGAHAAKAVRHWMDDYMPSLDNLKLPTFTDCRPYPLPQDPVYTDQFVALTKVRLEGGPGIPTNHPVFRLIGVKFKRYGISVSEEAPFTIRVNTSRHPDTPEKPEGYYLEISDTEAVISGNDYRGTVWGVVSFIQCVDCKTGKARVCKVRDWPITPRRGHSGYGDDLVEFGLFNKFNFFFNQNYCFSDAGLPDKEVIYENLKCMAKPFADFGLDFYISDRTPMAPKMCLTSDRTFRYHLARHLRLASYGANISMVLDDCRYPLNEIDAKVDGGKGWRIDNQYVQKLYAAVKEKYPKVKMVFCPTYYWGPHWKNPDGYGDTRAEYFEGIKTYLDPEISVFWSGNQVRGYTKTPGQVKWFTDNANRKPMVWQNAMGPHIRMNYGCEAIDWTSWHYPGFFENDCEGYMANADFPRAGFALAHMADALWHPDFYRESSENKENSLKRAVDQLCGEGMYDVLRPGTRVLNYMDRYLWSNGMTLNQHVFEENRDEIEEMIEKAGGAMTRALAIHPLAQAYSSHYYAPLNTMKQLLELFDAPPTFYGLPEYKSGIGANLTIAKKEAELNLYKDIFANAFDFHVGKPVTVAGRLCVQYYPKSPSRKGVWTFDLLEDFPGEYDLMICGRLGQEKEVKPTIRVTLNKAILHEGPAPFTHDAWSFLRLSLPWGNLLGKGDKLIVENVSPREKWTEPLTYYINYAILRPKRVDGVEDIGLHPSDLLD